MQTNPTTLPSTLRPGPRRIRATLAIAASLATLLLGLPATAGAAEKGIETDLTWGISSADQDRTVLGVRDLGAQWVRLVMSWREIETSRGSYSSTKLASYDLAITKARSTGAKIVVVVNQSPGWASGSSNKDAPPQNPADYANFVRDMASRYRGQVNGWEIWNEENFDRFWPNPNAGRYAQLLKAAYPAVKQGDPGVPVVFGGMAFNDYSYLEAAYQAEPNLGRYYDVMSVHPYTVPTVRAPEDGYRDTDGRIASHAFPGYREVRATMVAHGDTKPMWFTEMGWSTNSSFAGVSEQTQADYLTRAFRCLEQDPYVQVAIWYTFRNNYWANNANTYEDQFGLVRTDFSGKPAYGAFKAYSPGQGGCHYNIPAAPGSSSASRQAGGTAGSSRLSVRILRVSRRAHASRTRRSRALGVIGRVQGATSGRVVLRLERRRGTRWLRQRRAHRLTVTRSGRFSGRIGRLRRGSWRLRAEYRPSRTVLARSQLVRFRI